MPTSPSLQITGLSEIPLVKPGDSVSALIITACEKQKLTIANGDIFVVTQKIVSKSENRIRDLATIRPGLKARYYAFITKKDPRFVQLVLTESKRVLRAKKNTLIVEHKQGFICANAGIDHSNVESADAAPGEFYLLLPQDADASARQIRRELQEHYRKSLGVMVIDSHGRAWRNGTVGMTIGLAGLPGLVDLRGEEDLFGYRLKATLVAAADELAGAASLLMGQAKEGVPVVVARGFPYRLRESSLKEILRDKKEDLFR
jgi:coenzyme F420-0:L-glutamate ligase/coenzyme F420-1:gamma-L-glutamate ligase